MLVKNFGLYFEWMVRVLGHWILVYIRTQCPPVISNAITTPSPHNPQVELPSSIPKWAQLRPNWGPYGMLLGLCSLLTPMYRGTLYSYCVIYVVLLLLLYHY